MNINVHKHILLVSSYFTSANTNIMLDIIRIIHPNSIIHVIACDLYSYRLSLPNVIAHPISSKREKFQHFLAKRRKYYYLAKSINYCIYHISHILDHIMPNEHERYSYDIAKHLIREYNITNVYTVCRPFYAHNIGYKLSKKYKINWCTIWLDSYSNGEAKSNPIWNKIAVWYENKIFNATRQIFAIRGTFIGNTIIDKYKDKLTYIGIPYISNKIISKHNNDIIYAGLIGGKDRDPQKIMKIILQSLDSIPSEVIFKFYVNCPEELCKYEEVSNGRIKIYGYVSVSELDKILSNAYMLITIGNAHSFQLSSKVIQSISYRKPILFFYTQGSDISFEYFNNYPDLCAINLKDDLDKSVESLINFFQKQHCEIEYDELVRNERFCECTPYSLKESIQAIK